MRKRMEVKEVEYYEKKVTPIPGERIGSSFFVDEDDYLYRMKKKTYLGQIRIGCQTGSCKVKGTIENGIICIVKHDHPPPFLKVERLKFLQRFKNRSLSLESDINTIYNEEVERTPKHVPLPQLCQLKSTFYRIRQIRKGTMKKYVPIRKKIVKRVEKSEAMMVVNQEYPITTVQTDMTEDNFMNAPTTISEIQKAISKYEDSLGEDDVKNPEQIFVDCHPSMLPDKEQQQHQQQQPPPPPPPQEAYPSSSAHMQQQTQHNRIIYEKPYIPNMRPTTSTYMPQKEQKDMDEFSVFGEYIAHRLRAMGDRYWQCIGKRRIEEALFQTEMRDLTKTNWSSSYPQSQMNHPCDSLANTPHPIKNGITPAPSEM